MMYSNMLSTAVVSQRITGGLTLKCLNMFLSSPVSLSFSRTSASYKISTRPTLYRETRVVNLFYLDNLTFREMEANE